VKIKINAQNATFPINIIYNPIILAFKMIALPNGIRIRQMRNAASAMRDVFNAMALNNKIA
jgi:hypothetical protein